MEKFKVKITRTETYEREVEVEADNAVAAEKIAQANYDNNEYDMLFDSPDEVSTDIYAEAYEKDPDDIVKCSPFKAMKVRAKVQWDDSGLEEGEELPSEDFEVVFSAKELKEEGFIFESDDYPNEWNFTAEQFAEWFGEYLTSYTDFLHNGFTWEYAFIPYKKGIKK